jgi:polyisoprenoid-binding protein YceI
LKRSDFGLSKYLNMVSDEVRITISVEAIRE